MRVQPGEGKDESRRRLHDQESGLVTDCFGSLQVSSPLWSSGASSAE